MTAILFFAQRASAAVLAFFVSVHLATILYAVRGGLTAGEVLARTRGNDWFLGFYVLFVLAVSVHAPIGLRNVLREWTPLAGPLAHVALALFALLLLLLGFRPRLPSICRRRRCCDDARLAQAAGLCRSAAAPARRHRACDFPAAAFLGAVRRAQRRRLPRQVPEITDSRWSNSPRAASSSRSRCTWRWGCACSPSNSCRCASAPASRSRSVWRRLSPSARCSPSMWSSYTSRMNGRSAFGSISTAAPFGIACRDVAVEAEA